MSSPKTKRRIQKRHGRAAHGSLHRHCSACGYLRRIDVTVAGDPLCKECANDALIEAKTDSQEWMWK